jgi:hypothetical protein
VICLKRFAFCYLGGNTTLLANTSSQEARRASSDEVNWYPPQWGKSYRPKVDVVPNEKTSASIAEAILTLQGNIWLIEGALPELPQPGGNFALRISKVKGKVLFITHFQ